jgi:predicted lipoprotein with Yx(FWY)xxD motif
VNEHCRLTLEVLRPRGDTRAVPRVALSLPLAVAALVAACGGGDNQPETAAARATATPSPAATATPAPAAEPARRVRKRGRTIKLVDSQFGKIIGDGKGQAAYIFDKETTRKSECYGECAEAWPPVLTKGRPRAGKGAKARLLGTTRRRNGTRQVTYRGQPLYYYVHDSPGNVLCHDVLEFGGLWLVIRRGGKRVP